MIITPGDIDYFNLIVKMTAEQRNAERELTGELQGLFDPVFDDIEGLVEREGVQNSNNINRTIEQRMGDLLDEYRDELLKYGGIVAAIGAGQTVSSLQQLGMDVGLVDVQDRVESQLQSTVFEASQQTLDRMTGDITKIVSNAGKEGLSANELRENLRSKFNNMSDYELQRIAETELHSYNELSSFESEKEIGIEYHQWITAEDEAVRGNSPYDIADHVSLHGQIVKVGDPFSNGLQYPGDKAGAPEDIIRCRCDLFPYIMPRNKMAPVGQPYFYEEDLLDRI
jgi:SPP1 gp7 family putative phage head morphogenesis protein